MRKLDWDTDPGMILFNDVNSELWETSKIVGVESEVAKTFIRPGLQ
ncbi:MAG: hypothetical protein L7V86_25100 [Verrucomicrobiales bacterium]|nr:hypothetical protein [Verrucomicrobiales bacterium]